MISPGSMSLMNSAPIASSAQFSEDRKYVSSILPKTSGLKPYGSLTPMSLLSVMKIMAYTPCISFMVSRIACSQLSVLIRFLENSDRMSSESMFVWKIAPWEASSSLMAVEFMMTESQVRPMLPTLDLMMMGWIASVPVSLGEPPLAWPIAEKPSSAEIVTSSKTSVTSPGFLWIRKDPPLFTAIPADSWPLC